jgi:type IV fimbrial biogenesis protein FimT
MMLYRNRRQRGVTLVELMVAITVLSILLYIAAPSFRDAGLPSQLRAVANNVVAASQIARSEAIKRNATVTLCVSSDGQTCGTGNWQQGWIVTRGGTVLHSEPSAPVGYRVTPAAGSIALNFDATGLGATPDSFTVCRQTPTVGAQERVVTITATGRASVKTTTNGVCP